MPLEPVPQQVVPLLVDVRTLRCKPTAFRSRATGDPGSGVYTDRCITVKCVDNPKLCVVL